MGQAKRRNSEFGGIATRFPCEYAPAEIARGFPIDDVLRDAETRAHALRIFRSYAFAEDFLPSPAEPRKAPPPETAFDAPYDDIDTHLPGLEAWVAAAFADGFDGVLMFRGGEAPERIPSDRVAAEWTPCLGTPHRWARQSGPSVRAAIANEGNRLVLAGGASVDDPIAFMQSHVRLMGGVCQAFRGSLTLRLVDLLHEIAFAGGAEPGALAHTHAYASTTVGIASRERAFAADYKTFADVFSDPENLDIEDTDTALEYTLSLTYAAARRLCEHHAATSEGLPARTYAAIAGCTLSDLMPREFDEDPQAWKDYGDWLDSVSPGSVIGTDAVRTTLMMEHKLGREVLETKVRPALSTKLVGFADHYGLKVSLYDHGHVMFMIAEKYPNFEIVGWSKDPAQQTSLQ